MILDAFKVLKQPIVLPINIRFDIFRYLAISIIFSILVEIAMILMYSKIGIGLMLFATIFMLMPFCLFTAYSLKRLFRKVKGKATKHDKTVRFWLFSKMFIMLLTIIALYLWMALLVLMVIMGIMM